MRRVREGKLDEISGATDDPVQQSIPTNSTQGGSNNNDNKEEGQTDHIMEIRDGSTNPNINNDQQQRITATNADN